jgi:hypothetical protein
VDFPATFEKEVPMLFTRRGFFETTLAFLGGVGITILSTKEAAAKIKPELIGYQPTPQNGHSCATCNLFEPPRGCKSVDGDISPEGWCRLWIKKA